MCESLETHRKFDGRSTNLLGYLTAFSKLAMVPLIDRACSLYVSCLNALVPP